MGRVRRRVSTTQRPGHMRQDHDKIARRVFTPVALRGLTAAMSESTLAQDRAAIRPLPPVPKIDIPESRGYRLKSKILGQPLDNDQLAHERLGKPTALAVFASDALSSTAYASEEILRTLLFGAGAIGLLAFSYLVPITAGAGGRAGHPDLQLPPDDQGLPVGRRRLHRHQGQPRAPPGPGRGRRPAHRLHPHRVGVGVGRRRRPLLGLPRRCTRTGCRSPSPSSPSSASATCGG